MKRILVMLLFALALAAGAGARPAAAQTREDTAAVLLDAARQLRADGQASAADAVLQLLQRRYAGTAAANEALRLLALVERSPEPVRSGKVELLVFGTTYGLWLGAAVPLMLDIEGAESVGAGLLLGGPVGFLATRAYLKGRPDLTEGQARAITFGGTWGTWQGFGWTEVLDLGREACDGDPQYPCYTDEPSPEARIGGTVVGGLAGIATGALLARKPIPSGVATAVSFGALWGTWYGFAIASIADLQDEEVLATTLAAGDVGLVATALLAPRWNPSRNRARLVSLGGVVGLLGGLGLDLLVQPDDEDVAILIPALTSAVGLIGAAQATRNFDERRSDDGGGEAPGGFSGALLDVRDGRMDLGVPALGLRVERDARHRPATSLYVPVLQARF